VKLTVRAYNVGFGDCILISWDEPDRTHHAWIDFGTHHQDDNSAYLPAFEDIKARTGGQLDRYGRRVAAAKRVDGFVDDRGEVGGARANGEQPQIGAGEIHQILDQAREAPHLRARERHVAGRDRLAGQQLPLGDLQRHRQRPERVLDLVRGRAEHRRGIVLLLVLSTLGRLAHGRSKMAEMPWPTPMHMLASP